MRNALYLTWVVLIGACKIVKTNRIEDNICAFYSMLIISQFFLKRQKNHLGMVEGELRRQVKVTITETHENNTRSEETVDIKRSKNTYLR